MPIPLPTSAHENLVSLMYQAAASPLGIIVVVSNVHDAKAMFSQARSTNGDSALRALSFIPSPYSPRTELWIVKKRQAALPPEEELDTSLPIDISP
ncbi:MAG: hypothetical protein DMF62_03780 [Acidobacteria bacterium]|nr:MAG: hypothetical protein DMF62_03780 [Acidobacteriota bacterium]